MRIVTALLLVLTLGLWSCEKDEYSWGTDWDEGVIYFSGDVAADGCGWLLFSEGKSYHLSNFPEDLYIDGLDVWFKANDLSETFSCGLSQTQYKVKEIREIYQKPWNLRFLSDYPGRETSFDMFSLDSAYISNDSLYLHVGYSGGCGIHQFNLWALENGNEGELNVMLEHIDNEDPCEAYLHKWLFFSLKPLQKLDKKEVTFLLRGSPIMSSFYGSYTYKY